MSQLAQPTIAVAAMMIMVWWFILAARRSGYVLSVVGTFLIECFFVLAVALIFESWYDFERLGEFLG